MKDFVVFTISLLGLLAAPIESRATSFVITSGEGAAFFTTDCNEYRYYKGGYCNPGKEYDYYHRCIYPHRYRRF